MTRTRHTPLERAAGALAAGLLAIGVACKAAAGSLLEWIDRRVMSGLTPQQRAVERLVVVTLATVAAVAAWAGVMWVVS